MAYGGDDYSFNTDAQLKDYGDCVVAIVNYLRKAEDIATESLRENDSLIVYPTSEEAEKAWEARLAE